MKESHKKIITRNKNDFVTLQLILTYPNKHFRVNQ